MHFTTIIIGAGPAGLACAKDLCQNGIRTLVVEKNETIGKKVCAGGLTWGGLAEKIPNELIEKKFSTQHIRTRFQNISLNSNHPIIVTVNRENLGRFMLDQAMAQGAKVLTSTRILHIEDGSLTLKNTSDNQNRKVTFEYLVGADGSRSLVRKYLKLPTSKLGIGINYQITGCYDRMEWHLNYQHFKNGYGWIFPHRSTCSVGAYVDASLLKANTLNQNLIRWTEEIGIDISTAKCRADFINLDYRGWNFGPYFLAGDAAGLASSITGEGIYPAILSGKTVARQISHPASDCTPLDRLVKKHRLHQNLMRITGNNKLLHLLLCELMISALRINALNFRLLGMTD